MKQKNTSGQHEFNVGDICYDSVYETIVIVKECFTTSWSTPGEECYRVIEIFDFVGESYICGENDLTDLFEYATKKGKNKVCI